MPTPLTPWGARALELLADGEWHPYAELVDVMMPIIPPGVAFRHAENDRNREKHRPNGPGPRVRGDDDTSIASGRRRIAVRAIRDFARAHGTEIPRVERAVVDGVDSVRLARREQQAS